MVGKKESQQWPQLLLMKENTNADNLASVCEALLTDNQQLKTHIPNFRSRSQQIEMARYVAAAITNNETLVIEAGTGTGKTFAYLLPAILSRKKVVISTHTRYLQDQIYNKDLPTLLPILNLSDEINVALLKGRSNYLCLDRLSKRWQTMELNQSRQSLVEKIHAWSKQTVSGDINEFKSIGSENSLWPNITSTAENCLGTKCDYYDSCFVSQARKNAMQADIVIVNHYLLLADMTLKEDGFGQLLPNVDTVIVDEAHQLKDVADNFLGSSFGSRQIENLLEDVSQDEVFTDTPALRVVIQAVSDKVDQVEREMQGNDERGDTVVLLDNPIFVDHAKALQANLEELERLLAEQKDRSEELKQYQQRTQNLLERLQDSLYADAEQVISWYQHKNGHFNFYNSPAEIAPLLNEGCGLYDANWIYTSATLSVNGKFNYLHTTLGIDSDSTSIALSSPFNYQNQAMLYLPSDLPEPNTPDYTESLVAASYPLLDMIDGKTFFLFTSHKALQIAKKLLKNRKEFSLLVQGDTPHREMIQQFYDQPNALLLGTAGFWEGVDVRGAGLRCVIVDRLPFASPQDPLIKGRIRIARKHNEDFFNKSQLPEAVVSLRQGIGRLIRDESDTGIIMIGDRRLWTKSYGKVFMNSLPPMKKHHDFEHLKRDWINRQ